MLTVPIGSEAGYLKRPSESIIERTPKIFNRFH